ncbi:MAG TPA: hypothetical protein GX017_05985, partial [Clostridiales bacterium]|nr:hypothetical protein [Clostridiales bacterium]
FGNESGFALTDIPCTWTLHAPQDDDEWAVLSEFTFLSYLLAGAPDRIMLYPKGSDAKHPEDAVLSKTFTLADKFTVIPLGSTSITPKWFEGSWKHLASDTIIHFGVPDDNILDYTVSLDGKDLTTRTTISFDFQTASITTKYVSGTVSLKAATYYGYVEDGKDYIRIGPFRGEGKPGTYSEGEAIYVRVN